MRIAVSDRQIVHASLNENSMNGYEYGVGKCSGIEPHIVVFVENNTLVKIQVCNMVIPPPELPPIHRPSSRKLHKI